MFSYLPCFQQLTTSLLDAVTCSAQRNHQVEKAAAVALPLILASQPALALVSPCLVLQSHLAIPSLHCCCQGFTVGGPLFLLNLVAAGHWVAKDVEGVEGFHHF